MIEHLELHGYRGFDSHTTALRELSVVVGQNNAGKSTMVEALRLIGVITERLGGLSFRQAPDWTGLGRRVRGVRPSLDGLALQLESVAYRYGDHPARAVAKFASGEEIEVLVTPDGDVFGVIRDRDGEPVRSKSRAAELTLSMVQVLPQIQPLEQHEVILADDSYVRRHLSSTLSSRHFRNQLRLMTGPYRRFRGLAESTWPGIQILGLEGARGYAGQDLRLMVRDRDFAAEVARMGHGLQMWLQTVWFLARAHPDATVVLDEPDVYMHADLQRRLIRLVRGMFRQVVVATHSVEIMAGVDPGEILIVDRTQATSRFADTVPAVQSLIDGIGGVHNLQLARLWNSRRLILVEGDDLLFLRLLQDKLFPESEVPFDDIPHSSIGGWGGWSFAIGHEMMARNALGQPLRVYCIFDSDFHTPDTLQTRRDDAEERRVDLHIWSRKELENFFLIPEVVARVILSRSPELEPEAVLDRIERRLDEIAAELRDSTFDSFAESFRASDPRGGAAQANRRTREFLGNALEETSEALRRVSGKKVIAALSAWLHDEYGRGVSLRDIIRVMRVDEIDDELRRVVTSIERNRAF